MLPRLEAILRSGSEPHLSLKVLQFNAILLGPEVVAALSPILRELLVKLLTSCIHSDGDGEDAMDGDEGGSGVGRGVAVGLRDGEATRCVCGCHPGCVQCKPGRRLPDGLRC